MAELLSETAAAQPQAALEWCEAALAPADAEDGGEDAAFHRQCLLANRRVVREQLGLEPDELDQAVEAEADKDVTEAARLLGAILLNTPLIDPCSEDGPIDGVVLRWTRTDFPSARRRWPETTAGYGDDYETYAAGRQRTAHRWSTSGAVRVRMVTGTPTTTPTSGTAAKTPATRKPAPATPRGAPGGSGRRRRSGHRHVMARTGANRDRSIISAAGGPRGTDRPPSATFLLDDGASDRHAEVAEALAGKLRDAVRRAHSCRASLQSADWPAARAAHHSYVG
ncbi:hypothetical protein [Streptomyces botrytidirepellens]|uniref:hypothetical protein n=1 Tax=Streptomyces botrytidirepellens TaxID=2486417 RepID=UPI0011CD9C32|nr:hypothetical protein [Streptomyces botrytidirepellens]